MEHFLAKSFVQHQVDALPVVPPLQAPLRPAKELPVTGPVPLRPPAAQDPKI